MAAISLSMVAGSLVGCCHRFSLLLRIPDRPLHGPPAAFASCVVSHLDCHLSTVIHGCLGSCSLDHVSEAGAAAACRHASRPHTCQRCCCRPLLSHQPRKQSGCCSSLRTIDSGSDCSRWNHFYSRKCYHCCEQNINKIKK